MHKSAGSGTESDPALFQGVVCLMQDYLMIGVVLKPQGIHGECKIKPYAADLDLFSSWKKLYLESSGVYTPVPCAVSRVHDGFVYAVIGDCANADDAEKYRGRNLYIDRSHAAHPEDGAFFIADLIGCEAMDASGNIIGVLSDVLQYGPVDTWVFRTPEGTMMAPALLAVFPEVDPEKRRITVIPEKLREVAVFDH